MLILISVSFFPASAIIQETTVSGEVVKITEATNEITIYANEIWNGKSWVMYSVTSLSQQHLQGVVPEGDIFGYLNTGDTVQATFTGDEKTGVRWVTVAKVKLPDSSSRFLADSWGDPSLLVSPFFNNFKLSYETTADCSDCSGSICSADSVHVTVSQGWEEKNYHQEKTMLPGETHIFSSPEGCYSELVAAFYEGEASSDRCSGSEEMDGPRPFSNFALHLVSKGTATEVTLTPSPSMTQTSAVPESTGTETEQSPGFIFIAAGFGIIVAVLLKK